MVALHLGFNVVLAVVFLPLVGWGARIVARFAPVAAESPGKPRYLDEAALDSPVMALTGAARETLRVAETVTAMLDASLTALRSGDARLCGAIAGLDDQVDQLQGAVKSYLSRLDDRDPQIRGRAAEITWFAIDLEHAGDIIDKGLRKLVAKKIKQQASFSSEGMGEIERLYERTLDNMRMAQSIFVSRDLALARRLVEEKEAVRRMERDSAELHLDRIRHGRTESVQTSGLHLDILRDLKRINAHIASVAYRLLEQEGALEHSRLR